MSPAASRQALSLAVQVSTDSPKTTCPNSWILHSRKLHDSSVHPSADVPDMSLPLSAHPRKRGVFQPHSSRLTKHTHHHIMESGTHLLIKADLHRIMESGTQPDMRIVIPAKVDPVGKEDSEDVQFRVYPDGCACKSCMPESFCDMRSPDEDFTPLPRISHPRPRLSLNLALVWSEVMVSTVSGEKY